MTIMQRKYKFIHILFRNCGATLTINLIEKKAENWMFDEYVSTNEKTSDCCLLKFETVDGQIFRYEGYVPQFFPNDHYGDYVIINIRKDGSVANFEVTDEQIDKVIAENEKWRS
jgi:hypothetical protein